MLQHNLSNPITIFDFTLTVTVLPRPPCHKTAANAAGCRVQKIFYCNLCISSTISLKIGAAVFPALSAATSISFTNTTME